MKNIILSTLLLLSYQVGKTCSCAGSQSWCQLVSNNDLYDSTGIVWFGEVIDSMVIDVNIVMYKFALIEVYKGEIIQPSSALSTQDNFYNQFENSDSVIWIAGGSDASCRRYFAPGSYMVSSQYVKEEGGPFDFGPFGYTIFFCDEDVLMMNPADSTFSGFIGSPAWEGVGTEKLHFREMAELNTSNACLVTTSQHQLKIEASLDMFPNPAKQSFSVRLPREYPKAHLAIFSMQGALISQQSINALTTEISLENIEKGIYLVSVQGEFVTISKKLVVQ